MRAYRVDDPLAALQEVPDADRIPAAILDVDGTCCDSSRVANRMGLLICPPIPAGVDWARRKHAEGLRIVVVTCRPAAIADLTQVWLSANLPVPFVGPYCRRDNDRRPDADVKAEIYERLSRRYVVRAAIDDNESVQALWARLGIPS